MDITERLRELDKKGYQPLTGAIGEEAANEIERLRIAIRKAKDAMEKSEAPFYEGMKALNDVYA